MRRTANIAQKKALKTPSVRGHNVAGTETKDGTSKAKITRKNALGGKNVSEKLSRFLDKANRPASVPLAELLQEIAQTLLKNGRRAGHSSRHSIEEAPDETLDGGPSVISGDKIEARSGDPRYTYGHSKYLTNNDRPYSMANVRDNSEEKSDLIDAIALNLSKWGMLELEKFRKISTLDGSDFLDEFAIVARKVKPSIQSKSSPNSDVGFHFHDAAHGESSAESDAVSAEIASQFIPLWKDRKKILLDGAPWKGDVVAYIEHWYKKWIDEGSLKLSHLRYDMPLYNAYATYLSRCRKVGERPRLDIPSGTPRYSDADLAKASLPVGAYRRLPVEYLSTEQKTARRLHEAARRRRKSTKNNNL